MFDDAVRITKGGYLVCCPRVARASIEICAGLFFDGLDLPYFAAFHLLRDKTGRDALVRYYERYIAIAQADGVGFILESPTWRASSDWGSKLGYSRDAIGAVNRESIELMHNTIPVQSRLEIVRGPVYAVL